MRLSPRAWINPLTEPALDVARYLIEHPISNCDRQIGIVECRSDGAWWLALAVMIY
jgi:hypothetical protein